MEIYRHYGLEGSAGRNVRIADHSPTILKRARCPDIVKAHQALIPSGIHFWIQNRQTGATLDPCLIVRADGIVMSGVTNEGNPFPVKAVAAALEGLPDSAWPYGSVVAVQANGIAVSEAERSRIEANRMLLEPLLSELGVIVGLRPSACEPPTEQTLR